MSLLPLYYKIKSLPRDGEFLKAVDDAVASQGVDDLRILVPNINELANECKPIGFSFPSEVAFSWLVRCSSVVCYSYINLTVVGDLQMHNFGRDHEVVKSYSEYYMATLRGLLFNMLETKGKIGLFAKPSELFPIEQECQEICDAAKIRAGTPISLDVALRCAFDSRVSRYTNDWIDAHARVKSLL